LGALLGHYFGKCPLSELHLNYFSALQRC